MEVRRGDERGQALQDGGGGDGGDHTTPPVTPSGSHVEQRSASKSQN